MSKIICDVCGTSYPETASQCPICGCVRSGDPITVAGDTNEADIRPATSYTHVKGGRFSKSNVKKRNSGKQVYNAEPQVAKDDSKTQRKKSERGLIAVVVVLLLAIAAVVIYIALTIFNVKLPFSGAQADNTSSDGDTQTVQTTESTVLQVPCESLRVSDSVIQFDKAGAAQLLNARALPENHTDEITFASGDVSIATVDKKGKITAVGNGETVITVRCGEQTAQCRVICTIPEETTAPTVTEPTYTEKDLKFADNGYGYEYTIPLSEKSYNPYRGTIPVELVEFKSNDENVATVGPDGLITFVGKGRAIITAKYNDWEIQCILVIN